MPKKKTESENLTQAGQEESVKATTTKKTASAPPRRRRTAEDILSSVNEPPQIAPPKTPAKKPKTLAEELAEEAAKPKPKRVAASKTKAAEPTPEPLKAEAKEAAKPARTPRAPRVPRVRTTTLRATEAPEPVAKKPVSKPKTEEFAELNDIPVSFRSRPAASKPEAREQRAPRRRESRADKPSRTDKKPEQNDILDTDGVFTLSWRSSTADPAPKRQPRERTKTELPTETEFNDDEGRVSIATWRSTGAAPRPSRTEEDSQESPTRRSRNRRSRDDEPTPTAAAAYGDALPEPQFRSRSKRTVKKTPEAEPEPVIAQEAPRLPIERREESAQVAFHKGHPTIIKDKLAYSPIFFYADAKTNEQRIVVLEELKEATEQGLKIFSFRLELVVDATKASSAIELAEQIAKDAIAVAPDIQLVPRISFQTPIDWQTNYPDAHYKYLNGETADPSVSDESYWNEAEATLTAVIEGLRKSKSADNFMGVHFDQQEWFLDEEDGYDISSASTQKFRRWLRMRYRNDIVSLRASWYNGSANFDNIDIPDYREGLGGEEFVRTDRRARRWVDFHLFVSDEIVDRIAKMCYAAKRASNGDYLVGVSYGYTFEWSHPFSGHLSLGKLLRCNDLDYAAGPSSYRDREPGGSAAFPFPVDSFALNGKLYMSEEDFRTPISGREDRNQVTNPLMKTPQALESAHWRGVGGALAHEGGVIWMDSNGAGWLNSPGIWERGKEINTLLARRLAASPPKPDVALFIDERSLAYLTDPRAFEVLVQQTRESLLRSGLSVGFYLLSDLAHRENFPECKLYLFVNAWDIRPEVRSAIKSRLQRDNKTLFWLYTAGLFEAGRDSLERVREVTGIALRPQPFNCHSGTTLLNTREELSQHLDQDELLRGGQLEPSYFAIPEESTVLGEYTETGLPSFVVSKFNDGAPNERWTSVFLGEPMVTPGLFRALAQQNGAHVWSFDNDLVHANDPFVTVHCSGTGPRTLMLPDNWAAYHLDHQEYMPVENGTVKFKAVDGSTHTFLVGLLGDIQAILKSNTDDLLKVTEPILRDENTREWDSVAFDVAIMKLDEWVEESWSEDHADDLLLKPSMMDSGEEEQDDEDLAPRTRRDEDDERTSGRRRARRRRSPERQKGGESFGQTGVSVLFRKRN
ncbi:MAG: beta-galactosidase [Fimbriimonadaceae bacterium]